jgi:WhiB family transcriptional regulator, redox-sensing transcriptional regulator
MILRGHRPNPSAPSVEPPADPRPAWERVAYTWLQREVDRGQVVDPAALAAEVSVTPRLATDLVQVLRAQRQHDPGLAELRGRLVRDQITDAYLAREVRGGQPLDPAALARQVGTTPQVARQWLHALRTQQASQDGLGAMLSEPASHGQPSPEQLGQLQAHFAAGGHQQATVTGRPPDPERVAVEVERRYWTREVRGHQPLDEAGLARELGVDRRQVAAQLAQLRAGPATARGRLEQLWAEQAADPNRPPRSRQLAYRLGVTPNYVRHVTTSLRASQGIVPIDQRVAAAKARLAQPPATPTPGAHGGDWRRQAACRDADAELFFPPERSGGHTHQVARARELCASCQVRQPCLDLALHGPQAHNDRYGIFAGTTARQRSTLRGRPSMALGTRFLQDRTAAEEALALANRVSIDRAALQLGVSKQALRRAFDEHGLGQPTVFQGGPQRSRFYHDQEAARAAWQRAAEVGINQTRKELGVSDRALRNAWHHHGLGLPPRPATSRTQGNTTVAQRRLDPVFVQLNRQVIPIRARNDTELAQRVRRGEEMAILGPRVVFDLQAESRSARPAARVWAVQRRAERASRPAQRQAERSGRQERARTERAERPDRPHHPGGDRDER